MAVVSNAILLKAQPSLRVSDSLCDRILGQVREEADRKQSWYCWRRGQRARNRQHQVVCCPEDGARL